jgi:hypothetical protein
VLERIACERYLISTNGDISSIPDRVALSRVVTTQPDARLEFNYRTAFTEPWTSRRPAEEPARCLSVATGRDQHVDDLSVLTARYTYRQTSLTLMYVSSTNHRSPGEWRWKRAASASSGVNRCTHR